MAQKLKVPLELKKRVLSKTLTEDDFRMLVEIMEELTELGVLPEKNDD